MALLGDLVPAYSPVAHRSGKFEVTDTADHVSARWTITGRVSSDLCHGCPIPMLGGRDRATSLPNQKGGKSTADGIRHQ